MSEFTTPENAAWKNACEILGLEYRQRRITGALVALCIFHQERTPSMWMRPNGKLECFGCGATDRIQGFVDRIQEEQPFLEEYELLFTRDNPWERYKTYDEEA